MILDTKMACSEFAVDTRLSEKLYKIQRPYNAFFKSAFLIISHDMHLFISTAQMPKSV